MFQNTAEREKNKKVILVILFLSSRKTTAPKIVLTAIATPTIIKGIFKNDMASIMVNESHSKLLNRFLVR